MESLKEHLLTVARDRLRSMPGAFRRFENDIERTVNGVRMLTLADSLGYPVRAAADLGSVEAQARINTHLVQIVDEWAKTQPLPDAVPPLDLAQPKKPANTDESHKPQRVPKNERPDLLVPLIEKAQREAIDPFLPAEIWPKLCSLAQAQNRPLLGVSDEGIKWVNADDETQFFTLKMLSNRLYRLKNKANGRDRAR